MGAEGDAGAVAFTDIVGFTEFTAEQGDARALALLDLQARLVSDALPPDARVVKELGDGLMLWFPGGCERAVHACLDLQDRFAEKAADSGTPLWVRMGMHWGTPSRRRDDLVGNDVNLAARITDVAGPGELLVSDAARLEADQGGLSFDELGPVVMKGLPEPVRLFRAART